MTKEEKFKEIIDASKGFIPHSFHFEIEEGWASILLSFVNHAAYHIGRWQEVQDIKANCIKRGWEVLPWISEYEAKYPTNPFKDFKVVQVKEKFGGLRIYYEGRDEFIDGLIAMAESESWRTCFFCGERGERRNNGHWLYVSCEKCKRPSKE